MIRRPFRVICASKRDFRSADEMKEFVPGHLIIFEAAQH